MKNVFLFHLPNQFRKNCQFKQQPLRGGGGGDIQYFQERRRILYEGTWYFMG